MKSKSKNYKPGDELLPYQRKWVDDRSPYKIGLMARQTGKDFSAAFEGVADCYLAEAQGRKTKWLIAAPSERQSLESLAKWKDWAAAFKLALDEDTEERTGSEGLLKSAEIRFPGGSRVIAVPGKPETVRGFSANVLLTEFAFFENPEATWRAILPTITSRIGGQKKIRIITTPNGIGNKTHTLWRDSIALPARQRLWKLHFTTIYDAVRQGLPAEPEEIRKALDDPEGWAQEYLCEFLDQNTTLLPYELIAPCETLDATTSCYGADAVKTSVTGIDFGRKKDLTVAWTLTKEGDVHRTIEVLEIENMPTHEQVELLKSRVAKSSRTCLDYTGPGTGIGDYLTKMFGQWEPTKHQYGRVQLITFTNDEKCRIFAKMRETFERRQVRVPVNIKIREDLHSVCRAVTPTGKITYRASTSQDGHADRATALALAIKAGEREVSFHVARNPPNERSGYFPRPGKIPPNWPM